MGFSALLMTSASSGRRARYAVGPTLIVLGLVIGVVHLILSYPQRLPHMPALWDAVAGYPAAALLLVFGVILTLQPNRLPSNDSQAASHYTDKTSSMDHPHEPPDNTPHPDLSAGPSNTLYEERLYPSFWIWVITIGLSLVPAVIFAPINMLIGIIASALTLVGLIFALIASTPTIRVTPTELHVGRAQIERRYLGQAEGFTGEDATAQRGPRLHGLAYLCIRGWIDGVTRIELTDPEDRIPYWLVSSRRPEELTHALNHSGAKS